LRFRKTSALIAPCAAVLAACGVMSVPGVALNLGDPARPTIFVGLPPRDVSTLRRAELSPTQWAAVYRVAVVTDAGVAATPVAGTYEAVNGVVVFTPMYPLEPGRTYDVVFDPRAAGVSAIANVPAQSGRVTVPGPADSSPPTTVAAVYPGGTEVPANLLRMYIAFSGPMGSRDGQNYVTMLDAQGRSMEDAVLPLDTGLWNPDHTRFTVLFDPGRVKRGILPNRRAGRPLHPGQTFTIVVRRDWPDARARPLAADFRREYRVGPPIERPLSTADWRIVAPAAGSRDPLSVEFPWPLDRGLLQRALGVTSGDAPLDGVARVEDGERRWTFVPGQPWQARPHALVVQPELEDPSGNRIGRAFETIDPADDTRRPPARLPFQPR
jgi:hypothetical protein